MPSDPANRLILRRCVAWFLRVALASAFLSAVADRLGFWGSPGTPGVAWGDWAHFRAYADQVNAWLPAVVRPVAALIATVAEAGLGLLLLTGWRSRLVAVLSGLLLVSFALAMTVTLGVKAPLDYSVWSAAGGAFAVAVLADDL